MFLRLSSATLILTGALYLTHLAAQSLPADHLDLTGRTLPATEVAPSPASPAPAELQKNKPLESASFEILRNFESGERSNDEIQAEISALAGETQPLKWSQLKIDRPMRLAAILSHQQNLDTNFELLMLHTLSLDQSQEDVVTHYTNRISEADQQNIKASIVVAHKIQRAKDGTPVINKKSRQNYNFLLRPAALASSFRLQVPEGSFEWSEASADHFDPLSLLTDNAGQYEEIEDALFEVPLQNQTYLVGLTVRQTELDNLAIEVEMREKDALLTQTFILIYE